MTTEYDVMTFPELNTYPPTPPPHTFIEFAIREEAERFACHHTLGLAPSLLKVSRERRAVRNRGYKNL
jgi:hypothetical protein